MVISENLIKGFPRGHEVYLKFKDEDGKVWTFRCRVPPGGSSRPSLSGDWFLFVRSKQLKVGDVIEIALDREKDRAGVDQFTISKDETSSMGEYFSDYKILTAVSLSICNRLRYVVYTEGLTL
ncbi:hypothetical protein OIU79_011196 [Salix purpurea]|uniref:TF-B3 domain-containing protein n=1 Tax=Salix purpurea TaxID=77065 RepID=A0A9Q0QI18_SALPP|nr:hypothetical protein OIU79_011196 [Salix purpurea]